VLGKGAAQLGTPCVIQMAGQPPHAQAKGPDRENGDCQGTTMTGTGEW
jgi:hypothetical protein